MGWVYLIDLSLDWIGLGLGWIGLGWMDSFGWTLMGGVFWLILFWGEMRGEGLLEGRKGGKGIN